MEALVACNLTVVGSPGCRTVGTHMEFGSGDSWAGAV